MNNQIFKVLIILALITGLFAFKKGFQNPLNLSKADSFSLPNGKKVYTKNCAGCHGAQGQGGYGPNLCDEYWIYGGHYHKIMHVIKHGVISKGMTSFKSELNHAQIRDVAHYIMLSLKGTNPPGAKAPQGKKHVK